MKIEQVNENQIRCILTREDLEERKIKFSELTYGSEKANRLFRDMMQEAHFQFGFEPDDTPLMIEAVPMQSGVIVFVITKVEAPDELESRLAQFATALGGNIATDEENDLTEENENPNSISIQISSADNNNNAPTVGQTLRDLFQEMFTAARPVSGNTAAKQDPRAQSATRQENRIFCFHDLGSTIDAALAVKSYELGDSILYKNPADGHFYLLLYADYLTPNAYKQLCTILTDFCDKTYFAKSLEAYMEEHYEIIIAEQALQQLCQAG